MSDQTDGGEPSTMAETTSAWEYNAPQFVDFNCSRALDLNDEADAWFDQVNEEDNFYSMPAQTPDVKEPEEGEEDEEEEEEEFYDTDPAEEGADTHTPPKKRQRRGTRISAASSVSSVASTRSMPPQARNLVTSWGSGAKKVYPSASSGHRRSRRRSLQEARERMHPKSSSASRPNRPVAKTSEELELEKIEKLRKQAKQTMKQSQKSLTMTTQGGARKRTHQETQPTRPHEFHFQTDTRVTKNHGMKTRQDETLKPEDFAKCLRSNKALTSAKPPKGPTVPKPFHLTKQQPKAGNKEPGYAFHSDAEKVIRFQKDTPERFRTRARNDQGPPKAEKHQAPKLTMPHTPNLTARNRKRPITVVSAAEMEEQEVEEIKRFKFRAQPVNTKIFESEIGIPKVEPKGTTKAVGFDLQTEKRPLVDRHQGEEEETFQFKAQPVPRNILDGAVGIKKAEPAPLTVPASPAFALKHRVRSVAVLDVTEAEEVDRIVRANPVPHHGVAFQPKFDHRATVPAPFSFDERDKQKLKDKEEKIQKVLDEESKPHEFHAQPIPDYDTMHDHIPKTKVKPVTKPEPFRLESVQRANQRLEELDRQRQEELREAKEAKEFKARPATVVSKEPFVPRRVEKTLTEISEFELNTERRAQEREMYEERKHEKDTMLEQLNRERQKRQEEEQKQEVRNLRHAMVHKAQPIKHFRPVSIHPSEKTLTEPQSPKFSDRIKK